MTRMLIAAATVAAGSTLISATATTVGASGEGVIASFEGRWINLAEGWGDARACIADATTARCYRSEAEMDAAERTASERAALACSPSVRLYSGTNHSGLVVNVTTQYTYVNLGPLGFDNITSSYRVGACNSRFYDGASGGLPQYTGNTNAGASATSMAAGWDNRVSSIYIL